MQIKFVPVDYQAQFFYLFPWVSGRERFLLDANN